MSDAGIQCTRRNISNTYIEDNQYVLVGTLHWVCEHPRPHAPERETMNKLLNKFSGNGATPIKGSRSNFESRNNSLDSSM